jgi:hypothetical protein
MVFSLLLMVFGIGALCALMYNAAVYALPGAVGVEVGFWAINSGAGSLGGVVVGLVAGVATFLLGQFVFATTRSDLLRIAVALAFVVPAVIAGYSALLEIAGWGVSSTLWRHIFSIGGAGVVGVTAFIRLMTPIGESHLPAGIGRAR